MIWVDPAHDLVAVVRWMDNDAQNEFMRMVLEAVDANSSGRD